MMSSATESTTRTTGQHQRQQRREGQEEFVPQSPTALNQNLLSISNEHVIATLICLTCVKILLIPSYRSTDFDVHRNWLAITKHLPLSEWYFDNVNGTTVHTLDYPPTFAYFEYFWSHIIDIGKVVDDRCFELLPDTNNEPSVSCVTYQRVTVILSDVILWIGAYLASSAICCADASHTTGGTCHHHAQQQQQQQRNTNLIFLLIVTNPGLLYLDHVHFQYNGMLLGILLASIGCLLRGFQKQQQQQQQQQQTHLWIMGSAMLYALLVTMKHLYIVLAPLYLIVILKHYCYYSTTTPLPSPSLHSPTTRTTGMTFSLPRFLTVALVTGSTLIGPFIPFFRIGKDQLPQMMSRLFPFGRGLVHEYWAGNVWALYVFADKCIGFLGRKILPPTNSILSAGLPDVPPSIAALCLLIGIMPAILCVTKYNSSSSGSSSSVVTNDTTTKLQSTDVGIMFLHGVVFCSLSSFMLAYHVHEKAIMTAIIPMTLLVTSSPVHAKLFWRLCALGHFGLLPLLFRPVELPFKIVLYILNNMAFMTYALDISLTGVDKWGIGILSIVSFFMEVVHPLLFQPWGILEFLPLMMTSLVCAIGLIGCWIHEGLLMVQQLKL